MHRLDTVCKSYERLAFIRGWFKLDTYMRCSDGVHLRNQCASIKCEDFFECWIQVGCWSWVYRSQMARSKLTQTDIVLMIRGFNWITSIEK